MQYRCVCGEKPKFIIKLVTKLSFTQYEKTKVILATDTRDFLFNERVNSTDNESVLFLDRSIITGLINT